MDGPRLGTATLLFSFMHVVFRSRRTALPPLLLYSETGRLGQLSQSSTPSAEVQVSQVESRVRVVFALHRQGEALGGQQWMSSLRSSPKHSTGSQKYSQQKLGSQQKCKLLGGTLWIRNWRGAQESGLLSPPVVTRHAEVLSTSELRSGTVVITTLQPLELSQEMRWFSSLGASSLPWESEQVKFLHEFFLLMVCLLLWPICKCYSEYIFIYHVSDII